MLNNQFLMLNFQVFGVPGGSLIMPALFSNFTSSKQTHAAI